MKPAWSGHKNRIKCANSLIGKSSVILVIVELVCAKEKIIFLSVTGTLAIPSLKYKPSSSLLPLKKADQAGSEPSFDNLQ